MPLIDFSQVDAIDDFSPVPDGQYLCRLSEIETDTTRQGDEMWKVRWAVENGEQASRILFDNFIFSPKAMPRVKLICQCLGVDVSGSVELTPDLVLDRMAVVTTYVDDYTDDQGRTKQRNTIPYDGYQAVAGNPGQAEDASEAGLPF